MTAGVLERVELRSIWLVSERFDLWVFGAPALVALILASIGPEIAPSGETPILFWVVSILMVDVAHVWATIYRTYLDPIERSRRPLLYALAPFGCYVAGVLAYAEGRAVFWRILAYLAVIHFVRQQAGWMALYHRRAGEVGRLDRFIDKAAIYLATLFPLAWWHAHLPRAFDWFVPGDFADAAIAGPVARLLAPLWALSLVGFLVRQIAIYLRTGALHAGKILLVTTTAACWGVGIVLTNDDFRFTMTNVLIHGVPYLGFVWIYGKQKPRPGLLGPIFSARWPMAFYGLVVGLAYLEELLWDRTVWFDHPGLFFGPELRFGEIWWVPLLALPQATHYVLDGFIWKTKKNPELKAMAG